MEVRPSDLIQLKKDIERIRKHEEKRRAQDGGEEAKASATSQSSSENQERSVPVSVRIRRIIEGFWGPVTPSKESVEAIPDYLITLVQVIREQPTFRNWLLQLGGMPPIHRNQLLERMSRAFRIEDGKSPIAAAFDRLHDPALFEAVRRYLADESGVPETKTA